MGMRVLTTAGLVAVTCSAAWLIPPPTATAQAEPPEGEATTFEHDVSLGAYGVAFLGEMRGGGVGARGRFRLQSWLDLDLLSEHLIIDSPAGLRHDHPIGLALGVPIALGQHLQIHPVFGMTAIFSFIEPEQEHAPRADDIIFGLHVGVSVDLALGEHWSLWVAANASGYLGHEREVQGWTGTISDEVSTYGVVHLSAGLATHFGWPW